MMNKIIRVGWVVLVLFTFWQATSPKPVEISTEVNDKVLHVLAFFILSVWGCFAWLKKPQRMQVVGFLVVFGALIEIAQHFVPGRFASFFDFVGDVFGIGVGYVFIVWLVPTVLPSLYQYFVKLFHHEQR